MKSWLPNVGGSAGPWTNCGSSSSVDFWLHSLVFLLLLGVPVDTKGVNPESGLSISKVNVFLFNTGTNKAYESFSSKPVEGTLSDSQWRDREKSVK